MFDHSAVTDTVLMRLADGAPDPSFGGDGRTAVKIGDRAGGGIDGAVVGPDGSLLLIGTALKDASMRTMPAVVRTTAGGLLIDKTFLLTDAEGGAAVTDVVALPDGGAIAVGVMASGGFEAFALKLDPDGQMDRSYGDGGVRRIRLYEGSLGSVTRAGVQFRPVVATRHGTGIVLGSIRSPGVFLARLTAAGNLDSAFGTEGIEQMTEETSREIGAPFDLAADSSGRLVLATLPLSFSTTKPVWRFMPDGSLDTAFGIGGGAEIGPRAGYTRVAADGNSLLVFSRETASEPRGVLARLTETGELDRSFATGGGSSTCQRPARFSRRRDARRRRQDPHRGCMERAGRSGRLRGAVRGAPDGFGSLGSVLRQLWRTGIRASWAGAQGWGSGDKHDPALRKSRVAQRLGFL